MFLEHQIGRECNVKKCVFLYFSDSRHPNNKVLVLLVPQR